MTKFITLFIIFGLFYGCNTKEEFLSDEKVNKEKDEVLKVINAFNQANEDENFSKMVPYLADEVTFYGTDSSEVIRTFAEYKEAINKQWEDYDNIDYGDMKDVSIQMNNTADFCTVIYGMPCEVTKNNVTERLYLRASRTLKKVNESWVIVNGITGIATTQNQPVVEPYNNTANTTQQ